MVKIQKMLMKKYIVTNSSYVFMLKYCEKSNCVVKIEECSYMVKKSANGEKVGKWWKGWKWLISQFTSAGGGTLNFYFFFQNTFYLLDYGHVCH